MDWFTQAIQDIGNAVEDGVEAVGEFVEDAVETVVDFVEDTAEVVIDTVEAVVDSTVGFVETVVDVATGERDVSAFGDWAMNTMDDLVFEPVDYITGGAVDLDYEDGQFSAGLDFGIGSAGVSFGEEGFSADASFDIGIAQGDMSYNTAQGFAATGSLGLDWGGLPTVEGHVSISPDGDVGGGLLVESMFGHVGIEGEMMRNPDGSWSAGGSIDGRIVAPFVGAAKFSAEGSVSVAADGDFEAAGELDGYIKSPLADVQGTAGGQVSREDGQFDASGYAEGSGEALGSEAKGGGAVTVSAGGGHLEADVDTWGESEDNNVFDPSVSVTDTGLGHPDSIEDAFGVAGEMVGDAVLGTVSGLAAAAGGLGASGGAAAGQFADPGTPEQSSDLGVSSSVDTGAGSDEPMVEVPEPGPPDDFSAELAAADQAFTAAGDIWDDLDLSDG